MIPMHQFNWSSHRAWIRTVLGGLALGVAAVLPAVRACELCAIYRAADARGDFGSGLTATAAVQYVSSETAQFNGERFVRPGEDYLHRWMVHGVVGLNLGERFGVSLNVPQVFQSYQRREFQNGLIPRTLVGTESGLGDISVVGRWRAFQKNEKEWGVSLNVLAGVKLPSGDTDVLEDQERQVLTYEQVVGPGHDHDALGQVVSGVHPRDLSLGSGSVDGIFGLVSNARWKRGFVNAQFQDYLRSEGAGSFRYADDLMVSGGPGVFLWVQNKSTLSVQFNTAYETMGSDELLGRQSTHTGMTGWYLGPVFVWTWKSQLSALAGFDMPVRVANRGFQNVPDYRVNASVTYRF